MAILEINHSQDDGEAADSRFFYYPLPDEFTVVDARAELDALKPVNYCEARRVYNEALAAFVGGRATDSQVRLVARVEYLAEFISKPNDRPRQLPADETLY